MKPVTLLKILGLFVLVLVILGGILDMRFIFIGPVVIALVVLGITISGILAKEEVLIKDLEKFKLVVDGVKEHIIITDINGTVVYCNPATELITGYKVAEVIGKKAGQIWGKLMGEDFYKDMWKTIRYDKKAFIGSIKNKRKNGELYDSAISITPILDKKNEPIFFVAIERDTTKDVMLDRAKTEFVSLASHQLRTPLTAVSWYTELLLGGDAGKLTKKQADYLSEIAHGNHRMIELVNSLLDVSRMELGTFMINPEQVDICDIMRDQLKELKILADKSKIVLEYNCPEKSIPIVLDPKLTGFIFQNLISNAIKYGLASGVVKIDIGLKGKDILVSVSDNGLGIPKHQQGEIFKKLFRADNVRVIGIEGTGLGLYFVRMIVNAMGGKVWFESEENIGSTFYVTMPLSGVKAKKGDKAIS